jgi:hypothetical protein
MLHDFGPNLIAPNICDSRRNKIPLVVIMGDASIGQRQICKEVMGA